MNKLKEKQKEIERAFKQEKLKLELKTKKIKYKQLEGLNI